MEILNKKLNPVRSIRRKTFVTLNPICHKVFHNSANTAMTRTIFDCLQWDCPPGEFEPWRKDSKRDNSFILKHYIVFQKHKSSLTLNSTTTQIMSLKYGEKNIFEMLVNPKHILTNKKVQPNICG